jgi:hypothetical protein
MALLYLPVAITLPDTVIGIARRVGVVDEDAHLRLPLAGLGGFVPSVTWVEEMGPTDMDGSGLVWVDGLRVRDEITGSTQAFRRGLMV